MLQQHHKNWSHQFRSKFEKIRNFSFRKSNKIIRQLVSFRYISGRLLIMQKHAFKRRNGRERKLKPTNYSL